METKNNKKTHENGNGMLDTEKIVKKTIEFLQLFICETLSKRIIGMILIAAGLPNSQVIEYTGLCDKSVRMIKKALETGNITELFHIKGGGRQRKLIDVEEAIINEVENNDYHSQQQIADMVQEKFGIKVSANTIKRLLKKTESSV
jgi:transposase